MIDRIFGTASGRKTLYGLLFGCFALFSGFVYTAEVPALDSPASPEQEMALQGKHIWQAYNCSACHQFYGLGGYIGPDVTNVLSAKGKGEAYARAILQNGTATMPDFKLKKQEIEALLAFLKHADETGKAGREHFRTDNFGQIHPNPATP